MGNRKSITGDAPPSPSSPDNGTTDSLSPARRTSRRSINNRPKSQQLNSEWPTKGSYVHVKLDDWSRYYGGEVKRVVERGKVFDVLFDDGERIPDVRIDEIRKRSMAAAASSSPTTAQITVVTHYRVGDRVSCRVEGWKQWYDGEVTAINVPLAAAATDDNGAAPVTYVVKFDDGEVVPTVRETEMMKVVEKDVPRPISSSSPATTDSNNNFIREGGRCEAKCEGWHKYYPGTLRTRNTKSGLWEVMFDDGELRSDVAESMMRSARSTVGGGTRFIDSTAPLDSVETNDSSNEFTPGARVFANPNGEWTKAYPGTIERLLANGTVSILFDDGDRVVGVNKKDMTTARARAPSTGAGPSNEGDAPLKVGLLVEAKVGAWKKFYPGRIKTENSNGTYAIEFLDGELIESVTKSEIRQPRARAETTATDMSPDTNSPLQKFSLNDRVAAKFPHWRRYWGGYVTTVNKDDTYEITFDDGEVYAAVHPSEMKIPEPGSHLAYPELIEPEEKIFYIGDRIEAKLVELGWKAFYPGVVEFKNANGYAILFDDGDRFHDVHASEMRELI